MSRDELPKTAGEALARGYCITSRAHRHATRIDRPDWKQVTRLAGKPDADWYRRCESKDTIIVRQSWLKVLPNSIHGPKEYLP